MYDNLVEQLPDFSYCVNLKELDLQHNSLVCNKNFYNLKHVKEIWFAANKIDKINWVTSLDSIRYINMRDNPINCNEVYKNIEMRKLIAKEILVLDCDKR